MDARVSENIRGLSLVVRRAELGGKSFPAPGLELEIHGNEYRVSGPSVTSDSGLIVLFGDELAGELRRMDVVGENGPNKGKRFPAIYRFAGNGRELEICYDLSQKDRPPEFVSRQGTMQFRVTYTRKQARKN